MAKIYKSIEELIGRTPLMELSNLEQKLELQAKLIAKVEALNPGGSAKTAWQSAWWRMRKKQAF